MNNFDSNDSIFELDPRLTISLKHLDLHTLDSFCQKNEISFVDFLFLTRDDLVNELNLKEDLIQRILNFSNAYQRFGKNYTTKEVVTFFNLNNEFNFQKEPNNKSFRKEVMLPKNLNSKKIEEILKKQKNKK